MKPRLFLLLLCLPLLCACGSATLDRQVYPICLSVDMTEDGGFCVGVQAPRASAGSSVSYELLTATGEDLDAALRTLAASTPYPLNFCQIRLCVFGYRLAATTPMRPLLRTLLEKPTMRPSAYVSVALGNALDVLQYQQPELGTRLSTHLGLLLSRSQGENLLPDSTLAYCVRELADGSCDPLIGVCAVNPKLLSQKQDSQSAGGESGGESQDGGSSPAFALGEPWSDAPLPEGILAGLIPHTSQNPVEYLGSVALSHGRVSGVFTADETQLLLRVREEAQLRVARDGEAMQLQILLPKGSPLAGDLAAIRALVQKAQALRSDPFRFGCVCSMGFYLDESFRRFGFDRKYPTAALWVGEE